MPAAFPLSVAPIVGGYREVWPVSYESNPTEVGYPRRARRLSTVYPVFNLSYDLGLADTDTLVSFYEVTLLGGSLTFDQPHPRTGATKTFRYTSSLKLTPIDSGFSYLASLEAEFIQAVSSTSATETPSWPVGVPETTQESGLSLEHPNWSIRPSNMFGTVAQEYNSASDTNKISISLIMTIAQVATFETFYREDLLDGVRNFTRVHPRTGAVVTGFIASDGVSIVPFQGSGVYFLVSFNFEVIP